jgi:aspartate racemase
MAGVALHARIIENTLTDGTDQSHLCVHHYSCPAMVPDRTGWLLRRADGASADPGDDTADPAAGMARVFRAAARALDGRAAVGGVPCNTFHAPAIFDRFLAMLGEAGIDIRIVNMLEETMGLLGERLGQPPSRDLGRESGQVACSQGIGVLSTTGTRRSGIYDRLLAKTGYTTLYVSESDQALLHAAIYDQSWGIKATAVPSERAMAVVSGLASSLVACGASAVILACTELPLTLDGTSIRGVPLIDPVLALARALVREASPGKLKPLR